MDGDDDDDGSADGSLVGTSDTLEGDMAGDVFSDG